MISPGAWPRDHIAQRIQHLIVGQALRALCNDLLRRLEPIPLHDRLKCAVATDPALARIAYAPHLQLEGDAVPDLAADVFVVDEDLVDHRAGPWPAEIRHHAPRVQLCRDVALRPAHPDEGVTDPADHLDLLGRAGRQDHAVGLEALVLALPQLAFRHAGVVDQLAPQAEARRAALPVPQLNEPPLTGKDLDRQFPAVLRDHCPLQALDDARDGATAVRELLGTILHRNTGTLER